MTTSLPMLTSAVGFKLSQELHLAVKTKARELHLTESQFMRLAAAYAVRLRVGPPRVDQLAR